MPESESPLQIESTESVTWDDTADIIVVGFGGAGACTAIEARLRGADVLAVDRFDGGGATRMSGGVVYAGGTRFQREAGFDDNAEEMYKYLRLEAGDAVSDATLRRFCEQSNENLEWLEGHGIPFSSAVWTGKVAMPPTGTHLYYSGNEKVPSYAAQAKPAPRGHRTVGKELWTGFRFFAKLEAKAREIGVRSLHHAPVTRLVVDKVGRVAGVEVMVVPKAAIARHQALSKTVAPLSPFNRPKAQAAVDECERFEATFTQRRLLRAKRGVVLTTGGFEYNLPMLQRYLPSSAAHYRSLVRAGAMGSSGSGVRLAIAAGAAVAKMDRRLIACMNSPPEAQLDGIIVNRQGRRFINEDTYAGFMGNAINEQPDATAWLIVDVATFWKIIRGALPSGDGQFMTLKAPALLNIFFGGTKKAASLAALAQKCGIDAAGLEQEVARNNAAIKNGEPDSLGKSEAYQRVMDQGPYYAINKSTADMLGFYMFLTLGGLQVDGDTGAALRADGSAIDGLYAAGRTAVGVCSHSYFSGLSLADLVFSGRRVGRVLGQSS